MLLLRCLISKMILCQDLSNEIRNAQKKLIFNRLQLEEEAKVFLYANPYFRQI